MPVPFPLSRRPIQGAACVPQLLSLFSQFASGLEIIRTSVQETFSSKLLFVPGIPFLQVRGARFVFQVGRSKFSVDGDQLAVIRN